METKSSLHSKNPGRPSGTFGEATTRARAWHWLGDIARIAGIDEIPVLDQNNPRHPLSWGLTVGRRFETILQDGYAPDRLQAVAPSRSLFTHVAEFAPDKAKYRSAHANYQHPFWKLLTARDSRDAHVDETIQKLLRLHGFARLEPNDYSNGMTLGLISEYDAEASCQWEHIREVPCSLGAIVKQDTLDALQLLLLLYREAQDLAQTWQAKTLGGFLQDAALLFAQSNGYSGEQLDTWHYLIHTRMLRWHPKFQPSVANLKRAGEDLLKEWHAKPKRSGGRGRPQSSPDSYTQGRAERRWRRKIWARACRLSFEHERDESEASGPPEYFYTSDTTGGWLIANRALIEAHCDYAVNILFDGDASNLFGSEVAPEMLPPLIMPESLYRLRARPRIDEASRRHFGELLPYDVIPVTTG